MIGGKIVVINDDELDGFEEAARIVEAFAESAEGNLVTLLSEIAQAIRDRAINS